MRRHTEFLMDKIVYTYREIARRLGVRVETISDIVRLHKIPTPRHPANGRGLAIDEAGFKVIEEALGLQHSSPS